MECPANLCLIFTNVQSLTAGYQELKRDMVVEKDKHTIPSKIATMAAFPPDQKADRVVSACKHMINGNYRSYAVGTSRFARDKEKQLQTIRFLVFHCWLSFQVNDQMKRLVEGKVYPSSSTVTRKDSRTRKTANTDKIETKPVSTTCL